MRRATTFASNCSRPMLLHSLFGPGMPELGFEDGCAQKLSGPQLCQHVVGLNKRECRRLSLDARLRRNFEKIQSVLPGEVCHPHHLSFLPPATLTDATHTAHLNP